MDIDSRYPISYRLPPGGSGERAGDYINLGLGLSPLPQREKQRTIYSLDHARSGSNLHSASAAPLSFRSRHLPAVLDYCLDRNDFHGVSRAEGPSQLTWRSANRKLGTPIGNAARCSRTGYSVALSGWIEFKLLHVSSLRKSTRI